MGKGQAVANSAAKGPVRSRGTNGESSTSPRGSYKTLRIASAGDRHEAEADRVADRVLNLRDTGFLSASQGSANPVSLGAPPASILQRKCSCTEGPGEPGEQPCAECAAAESGQTLQRKRAEQGSPGAGTGPNGETWASPAATRDIRSLQGGGQGLSAPLRAYFEPRFGRSFDAVRIHTGTAAAKAADSVQARAFTLGRDVVFADGEYRPESEDGRRLLAHELTHVVQQGQAGPPNGEVGTGQGATSIAGRVQRSIQRTPMLDLSRLDRELSSGVPLTQSRGKVGHATSRGSTARPPTPDADSSLEVLAEVYPQQSGSPAGSGRAPAAGPSGPAPRGGLGGGSGAGGTGGTVDAGTTTEGGSSPGQSGPMDAGPGDGRPRDGGNDSSSPRDATPPAGGTPMPAPRPADAGQPPAPQPRTPRSQAPRPPAYVPPPRALIVGGVHGDERGPIAIMARLRRELNSSTAPLRRDFDTIVVPALNPGGVRDGTRRNRRGVDLNRNFPGISGFPAATGPLAREHSHRQLETQALMRVVAVLRPRRILALHAIDSASRGGTYADPVEGEARELACRMALRMRGTGDVNVRGNEIQHGLCNSRYPGAPPEITSTQSSLGAWGSQPRRTVITHEVPGKRRLAEHGAGRSVDSIMPGIREFLVDATGQASEADRLLASAVSDALLRGQLGSRRDRNLVLAAQRTVRGRFQDMNDFYVRVWRRTQPRAVRSRLPRRLTIVSHLRSFNSQAGIVAGQLARQRISRSSSVAEITRALRTILSTRSMPGFSRHHWGTEIDVLSADRTRWQGAARHGAFIDVIPFLRSEARRFGFFHPYQATAPQPSQPHYAAEPWHLSYWPLANVLQQRWAATYQGAVLDGLISRVARILARRRGVPLATMQAALRSLGLRNYQTNISASP